ncbi:hypothetical protein [Gloeothece verrucosa]|uniref:Uncharacterized protein n=1 Tax=Gloeothece verrucosa (strain PCC 7822) TaxID=497965 RepID=E0UE14_GLOV7|nr:hypothetical protein [Gloeothece verrucosa]ADN13018.1 hypothetical protein Cyan7822_1008 [Gloeothece verrucosa PCC 7822]
MTNQFFCKIAPQGHFSCHPGDKVIWFISDVPQPYQPSNAVSTFMVCEAKTPQLAQQLVKELNESINYTTHTANMTPLQRVFLI